MREFTSLTSKLTAEETTTLLNDYYDCLLPFVEANNGEVLKLIGDGVLAIFRVEDSKADACGAALHAAKLSLSAIASRDKRPRFKIGIGLHLGEVAYGNVGSGMRLDYTVVGSDVNLASRIAVNAAN